MYMPIVLDSLSFTSFLAPSPPFFSPAFSLPYPFPVYACYAGYGKGKNIDQFKLERIRQMDQVQFQTKWEMNSITLTAYHNRISNLDDYHIES